MAADLSWAEAARWVEQRLGLHFPPRLWPDLERGLHEAARRLGLPDAHACVKRALASGLGVAEEQVLAECLAIGETYLFRDPALFEQLAQEVLAPLVARRRHGSRHLRLWSAGCSTGEEAWSLAMLVAQLLPDWREWNISILATDVNAAALQKARAAAYGAWSLRGPFPPGCREFLRQGADGRQHVVPALRPLVRFAPLNLAAGGYPAVANFTTGMDLVLCRNVLIYFEPARSRAVLARLGRCLAPEGWLVTGAAELPASSVEGLRVERAHGLFALRPARAAAAPVPPKAPAPRAAPMPPSTSSATAASQEAPASDALERVRQLADGGALAEAECLCREAIARDRLDPAATYLLATILTEAGAPEEAAAALQRTLYLDPAHLLARFALGSLALSQGRAQAGRLHLRHALARLADLPAGEVLAGSGGLTARELQGAIHRVEAAR